MKGSEIIGEIQAATNGDVFCWAWISGHNNRTDGLTRGRTPDELNKESHWWIMALCSVPTRTKLQGPQVWATEGRTTPRGENDL